jgi:hypothetical protein
LLCFVYEQFVVVLCRFSCTASRATNVVFRGAFVGLVLILLFPVRPLESFYVLGLPTTVCTTEILRCQESHWHE